MNNRLVALTLSFCVLGFISCINDEECSCTGAACSSGVYVTVQSEGGEIFPEGEYVLQWETDDFSGEAVINDPWTSNNDPTKKEFYIPSHSAFGEYILTEYTETITLELYLDGESVSDGVLYDLIWIRTSCNQCTGSCEDLAAAFNAEIEMIVTLP